MNPQLLQTMHTNELATSSIPSHGRRADRRCASMTPMAVRAPPVRRALRAIRLRNMPIRIPIWGFAALASAFLLLSGCTPGVTSQGRCIDAVNEEQWKIRLHFTEGGYDDVLQLNRIAQQRLDKAATAAKNGSEAECWQQYRTAMTDAPFD